MTVPRVTTVVGWVLASSSLFAQGGNGPTDSVTTTVDCSKNDSINNAPTNGQAANATELTIQIRGVCVGDIEVR